MILRALRRIPRVEGAIFVLAIVLLSAGAALHSRASVSYDAYSSYDAAPGGYRALYELARAERLDTNRFERHAAFLDAQTGTLIYAEPPPGATVSAPKGDGEARAIEAWVRAGGKLVYLGYDDAAAKAKILALPHSQPLARRAHPPSIAAPLRAAGVTQLTGTFGLERWKLPANARILYDDGRGPLVTRYAFGRGTVEAVIDPALFDNEHLASGDRARLALLLLEPERTGGVWFDETAHGHLVPERWYEVVPRPFVYASLLAALVVLVAIIGAAIRLGPPVIPPPVDDRTSADFIDALSTLLERGAASQKALEDAVRSATRATARAAGLGGDPAATEIAQHLGDLERRADFEAMHALAHEPKPSGAAFLRAVALAQRLRKDALTHAR